MPQLRGNDPILGINMKLSEYNEELCEAPSLAFYQFDIYLFDIVGIHFIMHIVHNI
jgi:hypothetical protein